jgi:anti-anti-sigma regulatory factor
LVPIMLRITTLHRGSQTILKLEGKLLKPWIDEFCVAWTRADGQTGHVGLDLVDVTYVDAAGAQLLRGLVQRGALLIACSAFVAELLREPRSQL